MTCAAGVVIATMAMGGSGEGDGPVTKKQQAYSGSVVLLLISFGGNLGSVTGLQI